ncbi:corrinoid adenosyltransferase MMAB-like [Culicoides brevitarsis]|uniref:corrinoid adenosyltransferase MMAB-like n=1 Tax=Culicoides brevitarsis TaxID=469753 RepID=UPI00307B56B5
MLRRTFGVALNSFQRRFYCKPTESRSSFVINHDGDLGLSKMLSGQRLKKSDPIIACIGATEELNAFLGLSRIQAREANHPYVEHLKRIQTVLIDLANHLSKSPTEADSDLAIHTKEMEEWLDAYSPQVTPIDNNFIVPGGSEASATLMIARAVCRRVERSAVALVDEKVLSTDVTAYLNRLGDFLLMLSRIATKLDERTEYVYIPKPDTAKKA